MTNISYGFDDKGAVIEKNFNENWLPKYEAILSQGNGYLGLRAALEEPYVNETRNMFVAGTFNKATIDEVTELPNLPDITKLKIVIDGIALDLNSGKVTNYSRKLSLIDGELERVFTWESPTGKKVAFSFKRIVSKAHLHVIAQEIKITPLTADINLLINSGIDGRQTNSGSQHFFEGNKRIFENNYLQMISETTDSHIKVCLTTVNSISSSSELRDTMEIDRRHVSKEYEGVISQNQAITIEKISTVYTSRDRDYHNSEVPFESQREKYIAELKTLEKSGYQQLKSDSAKAWQNELWETNSIEIESDNQMDQLGINFALYHLHVMSPFHDERLNIAAKGLSGEGYKGHTFWDTEVFLLPYFIHHYPQQAKQLLIHRYLGLPGAQQKAKENGYQGAMYPWESAWLTDGETTPRFGEADIISGEATEILTGLIEHHISSDVPLGVNNYVEATGDSDFMENYGNQITIETAIFWLSRLNYNPEYARYEINDVIGPDEYKEHVNNNAYTNYMAEWTIRQGIKIAEKIKIEQPEQYVMLNKNNQLATFLKEAPTIVNKLYLPKINEQGILPQDDTYLAKENIDLTKYKEAEKVGTIFKKYNLEQVNELQVSKQADVLLLILLKEHLFDAVTKQKNWEYYEPRTLHDSSLSLATHSVLASDLENYELAYDLFRKATEIDLGTNMSSSDAGIHSAAMGGIWQAVFYGFAGIRLYDGKLRISPHLPLNWHKLRFKFFYQGHHIAINIDQENMSLTNLNSDQAIEFYYGEKCYLLKDQLTINLKEEEELK